MMKQACPSSKQSHNAAFHIYNRQQWHQKDDDVGDDDDGQCLFTGKREFGWCDSSDAAS